MQGYQILSNQVYNQGTKSSPSWIGKVMEDNILSHKVTASWTSIPLSYDQYWIFGYGFCKGTVHNFQGIHFAKRLVFRVPDGN